MYLNATRGRRGPVASVDDDEERSPFERRVSRRNVSRSRVRMIAQSTCSTARHADEPTAGSVVARARDGQDGAPVSVERARSGAARREGERGAGRARAPRTRGRGPARGDDGADGAPRPMAPPGEPTVKFLHPPSRPRRARDAGRVRARGKRTGTHVDGVLVVRRGVVAQDAVRVPGLPPRRRFRPVRIVIHRSAPRGEPRASPDDGPRAHPRGDARARARAPGTSLARSRPLPRDPRGTIARVRRLAWSACATVSARVLGRGDGAEPLSGRCGRACAGGLRRRKRGADDRRGGRLEKDELKRPTCRVRGIDATSDGRRFQKTTLDRDEREATIGERPPVETETRRTRRAFPSTRLGSKGLGSTRRTSPLAPPRRRRR